MTEAIGNARGHRPTLTSGVIGDLRVVTIARVVHRHGEGVARVQQRVFGWCERLVGLLVGPGRTHRPAAVGQEREVDRLGAVVIRERRGRAPGSMQAPVAGLKTVDRQRGAPMHLIAQICGAYPGGYICSSMNAAPA